MTVAIGLVCSDGVIVASDSMASSGMTARPKCKVHASQDLHMVWTAAGSVYVIEEVEAAINTVAGQTPVQVFCEEPSLPSIRSQLGGLVKQVTQQCYNSAMPFGGHQQVNGNHPFISDFLLLGWSKGKPWFLEVANDGQMNWHTDARFTAVGSGGPFASVAQALMEHYLEGPFISVEDGLLLAYRAIATTCAVSSGGVGMPVWLAVATDQGARVLDRSEVEQVGTTVDGWKLVEKDAFASLRTQPEPDAVVDLPTLEAEGAEAKEPGLIDEAAGD